jgi:glycosyltransferase involved in cell wall biosynthesis
MQKISAVLITLNAERTIRQALAGLDFCDEIVVVDAGSTDLTTFICQELGCRVISRKFDSFGMQKRFAVALARNDWVLSIDADEEVTPALKHEIVQAFSGPPPDAAGYYFPRTLVFMGRPLRFCGQHKRPCLRLFHKRFGSVVPLSLHEGVVVKGRTAQFSGELLHYSYASTGDYLAKFNSYTTRAAAELFSHRKRKSPFATFCRLPLTFMKIYLVQGGVLDGFAGFVWSLFSAMYPFVKYTKLHELNAEAGPAGREETAAAHVGASSWGAVGSEQGHPYAV